MEDIRWLSQEEAAERLGLSIRRTLEYCTGGAIQTNSERGGARKLLWSDVEQLAQKRRDKQVQARVRAASRTTPQIRKLTRLEETRALIKLSQHTEPLAPSAPLALPAGSDVMPARRWWTLDEASTYSGLSRRLLRSLISAGKLRAIREDARDDAGEKRAPHDRWRVTRAAVDAIDGGLDEPVGSAPEGRASEKAHTSTPPADYVIGKSPHN